VSLIACVQGAVSDIGGGFNRATNGEPPSRPRCRGDEEGAILGAFLPSSGFLREPEVSVTPEVGVTNDEARLRIGEGHRPLGLPIRGRTGL
jgi:hypothetical protein